MVQMFCQGYVQKPCRLPLYDMYHMLLFSCLAMNASFEFCIVEKNQKKLEPSQVLSQDVINKVIIFLRS